VITGARLVDLDGVTELLDFDDPVRLQALSVGYPDVRASSTPMPGQDGEVDITRYTGASAVTLDLAVQDNDVVGRDVWLDRIRGYCRPGRRAWLHVASTDWPAERRILVRGDQAPVQFTQPGVQKISVGFRAPRGLWESTQLRSQVLFPTSGGAGGAALPWTFPLTFAGGNVPGSSTLTNDGTVDALPFVDVYGGCSNPALKLLSTGQQLAFSGLTVQPGDFVRIDMQRRVVLLNNDPGQSRYSALDFATLAWWGLPPGDSPVAFVPGNPSSACQAIIYWRDTTI
jgi:hypothetical protein